MLSCKRLVLSLCIIINCLAVTNATAQLFRKDGKPYQFHAVQWGLEDGLSQPEAYFIIKDIKGFTWIGTKNGLNRFDGNTFKIYFHEDKKSNSLLNNISTGGLVEDSLHNIWIGNSSGVSRYNIRADSFTNFLPDMVDPAIDQRFINPFWATKNEVLCIESEYLIIAYDIRTSSKKILASLKDSYREFAGTSAGYSIFEQGSNMVWLMVFGPQKDKMGLLQVSLSDGSKKFYPFPPFQSKSDVSTAEAMRYDKKRNAIWINSSQGLLRFNLSDKQFHRLDALKEIESISNYNRLVGIDLDLQGRIWLATVPKGILIYDPEDQSVNLPFPIDSLLQDKISMANANIYCDRDGIIWTGFWSRNGIYQILPIKPTVEQFLHVHKEKEIFGENTMYTAVPARDGKIWLGGRGGLSIFNSSSGLFEKVNPNDFPGIKINELLLTIKIDTLLQKAWIFTRANIFEVDITGKKTKPVIFRDSMNNVIQFEELGFTTFKPNRHEIVFTSNNGKMERVFLLDTAGAKQIFSFAGSPFDEFQTTMVGSHLIFLKGRDPVANQTYQKMNGKWQLIHTPMDSINWSFFLYNDADSTYWVPANKQLIHFSRDFHIMHIFDQADGLPEINISNLVPDKKGNIWFHTEWAIYQLNNQTGQIVRLTEKDGYKKTDFQLLPLPCIDNRGDIFFPIADWAPGFFRIRPENFISAPSNVYFQSLQVNQKPFKLYSGIDDTQQLDLKYFQNKIEIETGIIDYYAKGESRLRYKLEGNGLKEKWKFASYYSTIRYDGLAPGLYRLVVQASNAANEFNGPEKVLLIDISYPFWETWWFRILAALAVISILYGIIQYRSRSLRQQNVQLEEKVMVRTKELKHSLEELRETQSQLIQREKMASLGELTAGIAHEIQNPLNFMNNFSEVNSELIDELTDEVKKGNLDEVQAIAKDIKENEQKINHHGKRADAIVKGMLQHSRSSTGLKEPTDINALADEYLRLAYHGLRAKDKSFNATLHTDFDEALSANDAGIGKINIIPQDIGRVWLNLINNAFYAVSEKKKQIGEQFEPTVWVSTKLVNDKVELSVRDNGNGISPKVLDKIFQPFFTTKPTGEGTGLGLSLSYDIITKGHGGKMTVSSQEGVGTEMKIQLPILLK